MGIDGGYRSETQNAIERVNIISQIKYGEIN